MALVRGRTVRHIELFRHRRVPVGVGVSILLTKFGYRPPVMVAVMAGLVLGAVTVVAYVSRRFRRLGPDLLRRFDAVTVDGVVHAELVNLMDGLAVATVVAPANTAVIDDPRRTR